MKKRFLFFLLVFFLFIISFSNVVFASSSKVFDDWLPYHDFFTVGDDYFEVTNAWIYRGDSITAKTLLRRNNVSFILSAGVSQLNDSDSSEEYFIPVQDCVKDGFFTYCLVNVSLDPGKGARSDEFGTYHFGTRIVIYEDKPDTALLELDHDVSSSKVYFGNEEKVSLVVSNVGSLKASNIVVNESVPLGFEIVRFDGFDSLVGRILVKSFSKLYPGDELVLRYWVKPVSYLNFSRINTSVSYDNPDPSLVTGSLKINVPWPLSVSFSSSKSVKPGERVSFSLKVVNNDNVDSQFSASISLPSNVFVLDKGDFSFSNGVLSYSGVVPANDFVVLSGVVSSYFTGSYDLSAFVDFFVNNNHFSWSGDSSFSVKNDKVTPNIVFSKSKVRSGEPVTIGLYLRNEDDDISYFSLSGVFHSDFFTIPFSFDKITPSQTLNPVLRPFRVPEVSQQTVFPLVVNGSFISASGENFSFSTKESIIVLPENQSVILYHPLDRKVVNRSGVLTVSVSAENIADKGSVVVSAFDVLPPGSEVVFGKSSAEVSLLGGEKRQLYVYKLLIPSDFRLDSFVLSHVLSINDLIINYSDNVSVVGDLIIPVVNSSLNVSVDSSSNSSTSPSNISSSVSSSASSSSNRDFFPEENDDFVVRIINAVVSFFAGLF